MDATAILTHRNEAQQLEAERSVLIGFRLWRILFRHGNLVTYEDEDCAAISLMLWQWKVVVVGDWRKRSDLTRAI